MFMVMFPIRARQRVIFTSIRYEQHVLAVNDGIENFQEISVSRLKSTFFSVF